MVLPTCDSSDFVMSLVRSNDLVRSRDLATHVMLEPTNHCSYHLVALPRAERHLFQSSAV